MIKGIRKTPEYVTYTFGEFEFKALLGIDDPAGVLTVQADFAQRTITVTMSPGPATTTTRLSGRPEDQEIRRSP
jgi:hypothetical protein